MQFGLGNSTAAASTLDRALAFHPGDVPLLFHRAYLHETAGAASSAETLYRRALDSDPRHADSLANLGVLLTRNGRHSEVWKAAHRFRVGKFSRAHDHPLFQELVERHRSESFRHPCLARRSEDGRRDRCDRDRRRFFYRGLVEPVQIAESIRAALLDVLVLLEVGMRCMSARRLRPLTEPCCAVAEAPRWQTLLALLTLVASDAADCVARAAAVLADRDRLRDLSERTRAATPFLFENDRPIVALNELMQTLAEQARERGID